MLNFLRNCRQFSKVVLPCYLLAHSESKFLFSTFLLSVFSILAVLMGVWWWVIVVLICMFLMVNDVNHLFMFCGALSISSLVK